jgi:hypothetical protein
MLTPTFKLTETQIDDLAEVCEIGGSRLEIIASKMASQQPMIRRAKIEATLRAEVGSERAIILNRLLFGIAGTFRRARLPAKDILDSITPAVKAQENEDERLRKWDSCRPGLEKLLTTPSISLAAKAVDISYDFERVFLTGRLLTSIRPVFDDSREEIVGSTIVQTLRLEFLAANGDHSSISIAMDADDIRQLQKECETALSKAEKAKAEMEAKFRFEAIITGEE